MEAVLAVAQTWDDDEGWGVCSAQEFPGGCWVHFSVLDVSGFRRLTEGDTVWLVAEAFEQDGYAFRATQCWPVTEASGLDGELTVESGSEAYSSQLHLSFDDEGPPASR
jgi:CspA family cold shock protein